MVGFTAALGGNRDWSCCLCGAVRIRALDQVPKQTLNSFHMSPTTDPTGQTHSYFICLYCSLRSSQTDTPHCSLTAHTQTHATHSLLQNSNNTPLSQHMEVSVNTAQSRTVVGMINHTQCSCLSEVSHR